MKKLIIILFTFIISLNGLSQNSYYWYDGQKVYLKEVDNKKYVLINSFESEQIKAKLSNSMTDNNIEFKDIEDPVYIKSIRKDLNQNITQESLKWTIMNSKDVEENESKILYKIPVYATEKGNEILLTHNLNIRLKNQQDFIKLDSIAKKYNLNILGYNEFMPLLYTLSCTADTSVDALQLANTLYETNLFEYSEPEMIVESILSCTNDPEFYDQWYLKNTGQRGGIVGFDINYCEAHNITKGDPNIIVAVYDRGIEQHSDLTNLYHKNYNVANGREERVIHDNSSHGMAVAGIIGAATNNNTGITGIAPNCPIMAICLPSTASAQQIANGFAYAWQNGASIINCSWTLTTSSNIVKEAIEEARTKGRNYKGTMIVFASGNNETTIDDLNHWPFPIGASYFTVCVGGVNKCGKRISPNDCSGNTFGSSYSSRLDLVAPGENIVSLGRNNMISVNSGTSFAAPQVAATMALILSIRPQINVIDLKAATFFGTRKLDTYYYEEGIYIYKLLFDNFNMFYNANHWVNCTRNGDRNMCHPEVGFGILDISLALENLKCLDNISFQPLIFEQDIKDNLPLNEQDVIKLYQNVPNPSTSETTINYDLYINNKVYEAYIIIQSNTGQYIEKYPIQTNSKQIKINTSKLKTGIYFYSLIVNGKKIDTKRMLITK